MVRETRQRFEEDIVHVINKWKLSEEKPKNIRAFCKFLKNNGFDSTLAISYRNKTENITSPTFLLPCTTLPLEILDVADSSDISIKRVEPATFYSFDRVKDTTPKYEISLTQAMILYKKNYPQ